MQMPLRSKNRRTGCVAFSLLVSIQKRERRLAFSLLSLQRCGVIVAVVGESEYVPAADVFPHQKSAVKKEEYLLDA